jgi:hypothetical protein
MKKKSIGRAIARWLLCAAAILITAQAVQAQYGLRRTTDIDSVNTGQKDWFDCANWNNAVPDAYTVAAIDDSVKIRKNGTHVARTAALIIDPADGHLTIEAGAKLEITQDTTTPASTRRFDEFSYVMTHNAHTNKDDNAVYAQQMHSVSSQLSSGVRGLMLDIHRWDNPFGDDDLYLCHGDESLEVAGVDLGKICGLPFLNPNNLAPGAPEATLAIFVPAAITCLIGVVTVNPLLLPSCVAAAATYGAYTIADQTERRKFEDTLDEIKAFLDANPSQIVTVVIEDVGDTSADLIWGDLGDAGLQSYVYDPKVDAPDGTTGCWGTPAYMASIGKRLIVTQQSGTEGHTGKVLSQSDFTVENGYNIGVGPSNYDPTCTARSAGFGPLSDRSRKIFIMNHFGEIVLPQAMRFGWDDESATLDMAGFTFSLGTPPDFTDSGLRFEVAPWDPADYQDNSFDSPNYGPKIQSRAFGPAGECWVDAKRYPTFLATDYFEYPSTGPAGVVSAMNANWDPGALAGDGYNAPVDLCFGDPESCTVDNSAYTSPAASIVASLPSTAKNRGSDEQAGSAPALAKRTIQQSTLPADFLLDTNHPNPFSEQTAITYGLPEDAHVRIQIYDIMGRLIKEVVNEWKTAGYHRTLIRGEELTPGTYFYRLEAGSYGETRKMLRLR